MLSLDVYDRLSTLLLQVPPLVERYERRGTDFVPGVKDWLRQAEDSLSAGKMPQAAEIASLRALLISVERGAKPPELSQHPTASPYRFKVDSAATVLRSAQAIVSSLMGGTAQTLAEAESLLRKVVTVAGRKGLIVPRGKGVDRRDWVHSVWAEISADDDLGRAVSHVCESLNVDEALAIFDRLLP